MSRCLPLLLCALLGLAGCTVRRFGPDLYDLPAGTPYAEAVRKLGNPAAYRRLPDGSEEGIWIGTSTEGGSVKVSYSGLMLFQIGRTETSLAGRRLWFDSHRHLIRSEAVGPGDPVWRVIPFGH